MTTSELVMDRRIVWNPTRLKEVDEAKAMIMQWKRLGHKIVLANGNLMERFRPALGEVIIKVEKTGKKVLKILSEKGDERIIWDKENGREALQAKNKFQELIKKGHTAYSVDVKGKRNRPITEFDVEAEEILMVPKTVKG